MDNYIQFQYNGSGFIYAQHTDQLYIEYTSLARLVGNLGAASLEVELNNTRATIAPFHKLAILFDIVEQAYRNDEVVQSLRRHAMSALDAEMGFGKNFND